ncbi:TetR/AcrR family transcriptional regulator [Paracoccus onubensis]|uniref:TetR/AcrR family transcriptional regulator n=1 Tax=Paracoccus onubensis TaxID=1675788 RepID=A0A418SMC0_9RHOB|nr:TetR/AcrR family transcriptional regulator [Paracoccus onubensis]
MDKTSRLIATAEELFDRHGYIATGMDRLTEAADMSSRTLYKHAGSKTQLMAAVLAHRGQRFMHRIEVESVDALFAALEEWLQVEGQRGCLFLRVQGETGGSTPEISEAIKAHKTAFATRVQEIVATDLGQENPVLANQVLVLCEGAIHAAIYRGLDALTAARSAAAILVARARS